MTVNNREEQIKLEKALKLYMAGDAFEAIARELGFDDLETLKNGIFQLLEEIPETREDTIRLEKARLEEMQKYIWPFALDPDDWERKLKAIDIVLKIMKQRAKLLGLNKYPGLELDNQMKNRVTFTWDFFEKNMPD